MPAPALLREDADPPQPVGHIRDREAFLAETPGSAGVASDEPDAQPPAERTPAELEPLGLGRFDHLMIGHVPQSRDRV